MCTENVIKMKNSLNFSFDEICTKAMYSTIFWKKPWAIVHAFFKNLLIFKNGRNSKNLSRNQLKLST